MRELLVYFEFPFVRYAFAVGILISLCSALFGVVLVLKRFSFIGDGLSHVAFGAMAVAAVVGLADNLLIVMPITVLAAVLLLKTGQHTRLKGDAAIAVVSVGALAVGYLIMDLFSTSANVAGDVCGSLFGSFSILTLTATDLWVSVITSVVSTVMSTALPVIMVDFSITASEAQMVTSI
jgi:zinc transport system permease protein